MKSLIKAVAIAATLAIPAVSFAQSNQPLTRAQVRQELIEINHAGYNPVTSNWAEYPENIQAAEARVAAQKAENGYGSATSSASESGH